MSPKGNSRNNELTSVPTKLKSDRYANFLGIEITKIDRGCAEARLTVAERMLNFNGFAHGGPIFSLADAAFAAASNSFNQTAVALSFHTAYRRPVQVDTRLVAEAVEES